MDRKFKQIVKEFKDTNKEYCELNELSRQVKDDLSKLSCSEYRNRIANDDDLVKLDV